MQQSVTRRVTWSCETRLNSSTSRRQAAMWASLRDNSDLTITSDSAAALHESQSDSRSSSSSRVRASITSPYTPLPAPTTTIQLQASGVTTPYSNRDRRRNHHMGPWDASPPTMENYHGGQVYLVPSNFCNWLSFFHWAV